MADIRSDGLIRSWTDGRGLVRSCSYWLDGRLFRSSEVRYPDGSVARQELGPDPRFGMEAPLVVSSSLELPSGPSRPPGDRCRR